MDCEHTNGKGADGGDSERGGVRCRGKGERWYYWDGREGQRRERGWGTSPLSCCTRRHPRTAPWTRSSRPQTPSPARAGDAALPRLRTGRSVCANARSERTLATITLTPSPSWDERERISPILAASISARRTSFTISLYSLCGQKSNVRDLKISSFTEPTCLLSSFVFYRVVQPTQALFFAQEVELAARLPSLRATRVGTASMDASYGGVQRLAKDSILPSGRSFPKN